MQISDEEILSAVHRYLPIRGQGTIANMLAFGRVLKALGIKTSLSQVIDANRALEHVDVSRKADFYTALRSNLVTAKEEIPLFNRVFEFFWREHSPETLSMESFAAPKGANEAGQESDGEGGAFEEVMADEGPDDEEKADSEPVPLPAYSPSEVLSQKDFSEMGIEESRAITQAILLIASKIATQMSRRKKRASKGEEVDPRWTMRRSIKYGGEVIELVTRKRRIKKTRVVLLCDVSGSMDCYSRFLIQFMYGLQNELWGVETFVFSTSLSRITHLIRTRNIASALERISGSVLGWSGGTNIGRSLYTFNRDFAPSLVTHRTVVVIISDGWDRGDVTLLENEMRTLKKRCRRIIWLNPLLASENYEPLCKGMQAALPHIDLFLSVHNLDSLVHLGRTLQKMVA
ncbi:MAG: VWA domain-containing protein [Deltaproteobacteria bacterium]|nr:VWA domain-containing protein [Deltaproteobacteria bacterium]